MRDAEEEISAVLREASGTAVFHRAHITFGFKVKDYINVHMYMYFFLSVYFRARYTAVVGKGEGTRPTYNFKDSRKRYA